MEITRAAGEAAQEESYPKIEARAGKTSRRYAASISLGETGFFELNHQASADMYVDTTKCARSSGGTGTSARFRFCSSSFNARETIPAKTE
jgi:hypothetical protein